MTTGNTVCRVLMTGASGLLGYHFRAALLAENCASDFAQRPRLYEFINLPRISDDSLDQWLHHAKSADLILHLAGITRADPKEVEFGNIEINQRMVQVLEQSGSKAHVMYTNSIHTGSDTPYGRGKDEGHRMLQAWSKSQGTRYTNIVVPHLFGETAKPRYNNVTATLCDHVAYDTQPTIHDGANVELLHSAAAVDKVLAAFHDGTTGTFRLQGKPMLVQDLYELIMSFRESYEVNTYPDLTDPFITAVFNTYRSVDYPTAFPKMLELHKDERGMLYEAVKGGGGGQTLLSWTDPGIVRGNHFHRYKIERFLVVSGEAEIRIRPVFGDKIDTYKVNGDQPAYVDMPSFHTHSIVNTGKEPLLTLFWANEVFNPESPDTYAHPVIPV